METYCESYRQYVKKLRDLNNQPILISCIVHGLVHLCTALERMLEGYTRRKVGELMTKTTEESLKYFRNELDVTRVQHHCMMLESLTMSLNIFEAMRRFTKEPHAVRDQLVAH